MQNYLVVVSFDGQVVVRGQAKSKKDAREQIMNGYWHMKDVVEDNSDSYEVVEITKEK